MNRCIIKNIKLWLNKACTIREVFTSLPLDVQEVSSIPDQIRNGGRRRGSRGIPIP